jgi:hypothetical protein
MKKLIMINIIIPPGVTEATINDYLTSVVEAIHRSKTQFQYTVNEGTKTKMIPLASVVDPDWDYVHDPIRSTGKTNKKEKNNDC